MTVFHTCPFLAVVLLTWEQLKEGNRSRAGCRFGRWSIQVRTSLQMDLCEWIILRGYVSQQGSTLSLSALALICAGGTQTPPVITVNYTLHTEESRPQPDSPSSTPRRRGGDEEPTKKRRDAEARICQELQSVHCPFWTGLVIQSERPGNKEAGGRVSLEDSLKFTSSIDSGEQVIRKKHEGLLASLP